MLVHPLIEQWMESSDSKVLRSQIELQVACDQTSINRRRKLKQEVPGSSPMRGTKFKVRRPLMDLLFVSVLTTSRKCPEVDIINSSIQFHANPALCLSSGRSMPSRECYAGLVEPEKAAVASRLNSIRTIRSKTQ